MKQIVTIKYVYSKEEWDAMIKNIKNLPNKINFNEKVRELRG